MRINGKCQGQCKGDGVVQGFEAVRRDFPSPVQGPLRDSASERTGKKPR